MIPLVPTNFPFVGLDSLIGGGRSQAQPPKSEWRIDT
jgi:hypothetical protein